MKISYAVTVKDEDKELIKLLDILNKYRRDGDEVVVLADLPVSEVIDCIVTSRVTFFDEVDLFEAHSLNGNFAEHKNYLNSKCSGDWIFAIDADEFPHEHLLNVLPQLIDNDVDLFFVPRINTVTGLTQEHVNKWGWVVNNDGYVNFPDLQGRLYRNSKDIYWINKVHETVTGYEKFAKLPQIEDYCLYHHKTIERQEKQNEFYQTLI